MPFPPRVIETRENIEDIYQDNGHNMLEKTCVSSMVGLLTQLNDVSKFASEIFTDILTETEKNQSRIENCRSRLSSLSGQVAPIEKLLSEKSPAYFYDNPYTGEEYRRQDNLRGLLFRRDRATMEVNRRREEAEPLPDLNVMNQYSDNPAVPCISKFSDPEFFMNEWIEAERQKIEEERQKRKQRKKEKKKKREEKKTIKAVKKKRYDKVTGKVISVDEEVIQVKQYALSGDKNTADLNSYSGVKKSESVSGKSAVALMANAQKKKKEQKQRKKRESVKKNAPPIEAMEQADSIPNEQKVENGGAVPPKPPANVSVPQENKPPPPIPQEVRGSAHAPPPPFVPGNVVAPGPGAGPPQFIPPAAEEVADVHAEESEKLEVKEEVKLSAFEMAQQSANMVEQPKPKEPQVGMKSNMLLAQIRGGAQLKKSAPPVKREVKQDKRSMLMDGLRKGINLKKVNKAQNKPEPKKEENTAIFEILKRRQVMFDESDSADSDGWGSESE